MSKPQLKNSLLVKKHFADLIADVVAEVKDEFKNLKIEDVKNDLHVILYIMEKVDYNVKHMASVKASLDKNALLLEIMKQLLPDLTDSEVESIKYVVSFVLENGMLKKRSIVRSAVKLVSSFLRK